MRRSSKAPWLIAVLLLIGVPSLASDPGIQYPWKFAYVTDTHTNWGFYGSGGTKNSVPFGAVIDTLNQIGIDFLVLGGDWDETRIQLVQSAEDSFVAITGRASFDLLPVLGNWEAIAADQALEVDPFTTARSRYPVYFTGKNYWMVDHKNVRIVSLNDNTSYGARDSTDYSRDNPEYMGVVPGWDLDGITVTSSPQRAYLRNALATRNKSHWFIAAFHRPVFGSNANDSTRYNFGLAARGTGFVNEIEDSLKSDERFIALCGDQHIPLWITKAIADSAVAGATSKGGYHIILSSGAGLRAADTTDVLPAGTTWLESYLARSESDSTLMIGRTSEAWADTMTSIGDKGFKYIFTWSLFTVYGDVIEVRTYRTWTSESVTPIKHPKTNGTLNHKLIDRRTLRRDF